MNLTEITDKLNTLKNAPWNLVLEDFDAIHKYVTFVETQYRTAQNKFKDQLRTLLQTEEIQEDE